MKLKLDVFKKSIDQLREAIEFSCSEMAKQDPRLFKQFRNSVIQCFEFTYELSWKMIKRQLVQDAPTPAAIDEMGFNDMMREAAMRGLIEDPVQWMHYRKERNVTSHAYDEKLAQEVYEIALIFLKDIEKLLQTLQERNV